MESIGRKARTSFNTSGKMTGPEWKPRKCKACKITYKPTDSNPWNAKRSRFCCGDCKRNYRRSGGMNLNKLTELVAGIVTRQLLADENFAEKLADKLAVGRIKAIVQTELDQQFETVWSEDHGCELIRPKSAEATQYRVTHRQLSAHEHESADSNSRTTNPTGEQQ